MTDEEQPPHNEEEQSRTHSHAHAQQQSPGAGYALPTVEEGVPTIPAPIDSTTTAGGGGPSPSPWMPSRPDVTKSDNDGNSNDNPRKFDKKLSIVSKQYDREGKGYLDETELALRHLDSANMGYLDMERVFALMDDLRREQKANVNLKKAVAALAVFAVILALANMGTAFAAAILAKDTTVDQSTGDLVGITTGERLGTTAKKDVYDVVTLPDGTGAGDYAYGIAVPSSAAAGSEDAVDEIEIDPAFDDAAPRRIPADDVLKIWSDCSDGGSGVRLMEDCDRDGMSDTPTDLACTRRTESFDDDGDGDSATKNRRTVFQFTARRPEGAAFGTVSMVCGDAEMESGGGEGGGECDVVGMTCNAVCPDGLVCGEGQTCCCNRCVDELEICNRAWCGTGDEMLEGPV